MRCAKISALTPLAALAACGGATDGDRRDAESGAPYDSSSGAPIPDGSEAETPPTDDSELGSDRIMQGRWFADTMAGMDAALFGPPETEAGFSVRCDEAAGELIFTRSAREPAGSAEMRLMAGGFSRTIDAVSTPDPMPTVTARLAANDQFAPLLADATEPIAVAIGDGASYRMPAGAPLRDVAAGCGR